MSAEPRTTEEWAGHVALDRDRLLVVMAAVTPHHEIVRAAHRLRMDPNDENLAELDRRFDAWEQVNPAAAVRLYDEVAGEPA